MSGITDERRLFGRLRTAALVAVVLTCHAPMTVRGQDASAVEPIRHVASRVVKIFGAGGLQGLSDFGSGFLISADGHIATVWSHVLDAEFVTVVLDDGRRFEGKLVGAEPALDVAVLKIDGENLPYFELTDAVPASLGSRVLAFSNMFEVANGDEPVSVQHGVLSARINMSARRGAFESRYDGPIYVVDAITNNPGAAGGVLTTRDGRLLGMLGKELRDARTGTWLNYALPIEVLRTPITQIVTGDFSKKETDPDDVPKRLNRYAPRDFGLVMIPDVVARTPPYVDRIPADGPAAGKIQPGDLIIFVGDTLVSSVRVLNEEIGKLESGGNVRLVVRRGNELVTVELPIPRKN